MTLRPTDYAALAQDSYKNPILNQSVKIGGVEYTPIAYANDPHTGFQATAYDHKDASGAHEVVIAYRGTEFGREPVHDGAVDAGMVLVGVNAQTSDSMAFTQRVMTQAQERAKANGYALDISVTGHSLGGTLAEINAHKFGLHGDTFNAYGSAGLAQGIPAGGNQVIDYVRATDVVSAGSPHFGEVRTYATQQDIDHLSQAGYRNDGGALSPRDLIGEIRRDGVSAHAIANFAPDKNGRTIMTPGNLALAHDNEAMISRYRNDIGNARFGVSMVTGAAENALAVDGIDAVGHSLSKVSAAAEQSSVRAYEAARETVLHEAHIVQGKAVEGLHATEYAAQYVEHEAAKGYHATVDAASRGIDATVHAADEVAKQVSRGTHAIGAAAGEAYSQRHPAGWSSPRLNDPAHPDHRLFQQAYDGVKKIDAEHGRASDHRSVNLAGVLAVEGKAAGLKQIDVVALSHDGSNAFAAQKEARLGFPNVVHVNTTQAVNTPIEHSTQQMAQVNQQQAQVHAQVQAQMQVQNQASQAAPGPQMGGPGR
jgi:hypothetical protein